MKSAITISLDKGLLRACRSAAFAARRTLSSQIEQWIDEKLALDAAAASAPSSPALSPPPLPDPDLVELSTAPVNGTPTPRRRTRKEVLS